MRTDEEILLSLRKHVRKLPPLTPDVAEAIRYLHKTMRGDEFAGSLPLPTSWEEMLYEWVNAMRWAGGPLAVYELADTFWRHGPTRDFTKASLKYHAAWEICAEALGWNDFHTY